MLLTTGAIALSRKVADERAKRREKKQGHLQIGSSDVAKRAFGAQTSRMIEDGSAGSAGISRGGTDIKFEDADQITADSPSVPSVGVSSADVEVNDARSTSQMNVASPVQSEKASFGVASPSTETPTSAGGWPANSSTLSPGSATTEPPPYSPRPESSSTGLSSSVYSRDTKDSDTNTLTTSDTRSIMSGSTVSYDGHGVRVKTKGTDLKSGFPYHPALFELRINPSKWEDFSYQIAETTKFDNKDYARMIGAATATAMTGAIGTSVWVGKSMNRKIQQEKVMKGLVDTTEGGLGDMLKQWNDDYFGKLGLLVHLELSESALKNPDKKAKTFRKPTVMYGSREERERKTEERKFVLVVTKLDDEASPSEATRGIDEKNGGAVEIGSSGEVQSTIAEMPADEGTFYAELPAEMPAGVWDKDKKEKTLDLPEGYVEMEGSAYVEMDGDNSATLEKLHLESDNLVEADPDAETNLTPKPLGVNTDSAALNKEIA